MAALKEAKVVVLPTTPTASTEVTAKDQGRDQHQDQDQDQDQDRDNVNIDNDNDNDDEAQYDNHDNIAQQQQEQQHEQTSWKPPPRKRRRLVISCTECHRRKQKCDRKLPCTNCQTRNKESACRYETGKPIRKEVRNGYGASNGGPSPEPQQPLPPPPQSQSQPQPQPHPVRPNTIDLGYSTNSNSPLDILKKIDSGGGGGGDTFAGLAAEMFEGDSMGVRERYKLLVRQLPARSYLDQLMKIYDRDINWQYCGLDMPILQELIDRWYDVPFSLLNNSGPQGLDPMLRAMPALMFQIMASSLLYLPDDARDNFNSLKYANMTFDDLALEYSESGVGILSLLGKRQMSIVTVLAGWVRAGFLKYTGQVTEAWHQIGAAIRDAQEIGLHLDQGDPQPMPEDSADDILDKLWMTQFRRRVWMTLVAWDLHTGAVLGRPTSVDFRTMNRSMPIDVVLPNDKKKLPLVPRGDDDPPTALTRAIWAFELMRPLREVLDLEMEGPFPKDFAKLDRLHQQIMDVQNGMPAAFRLEDPDTRFDHLPECWWLPLARPNLPQLVAFNFMALHRPYIFTRAVSRHEALRSSIEMLELQRITFSIMKPHHFKSFSLFFGTFDAVVMVASIYILFPRENVEMLPIAVQHFRWAVERFERMADHNRLAQAALGVLNAIYIRFKKAVGAFFRCEQNMCIARNSGITSGMTIVNGCPYGLSSYTESQAQTTDSNSNSPSDNNSRLTPNTTPSSVTSAKMIAVTDPGMPSSFGAVEPIGSATPGTAAPLLGANAQGGSNNNLLSSAATTSTAEPSIPNVTAAAEWSFPADVDFSNIMPMYPMSDLLYHDLTGVLANSNGNGNSNMAPTSGGGDGGGGIAWPSHGIVGSEGLVSGDGDVGDQGQGQGQDQGMQGGMSANADSAMDLSGDQPWQFGGDFGNDTIWSLLNQIPSQ